LFLEFYYPVEIPTESIGMSYVNTSANLELEVEFNHWLSSSGVKAGLSGVVTKLIKIPYYRSDEVLATFKTGFVVGGKIFGSAPRRSISPRLEHELANDVADSGVMILANGLESIVLLECPVIENTKFEMN
jgi:hypothetical protein